MGGEKQTWISMDKRFVRYKRRSGSSDNLNLCARPYQAVVPEFTHNVQRRIGFQQVRHLQDTSEKEDAEGAVQGFCIIGFRHSSLECERAVWMCEKLASILLLSHKPLTMSKELQLQNQQLQPSGAKDSHPYPTSTRQAPTLSFISSDQRSGIGLFGPPRFFPGRLSDL